MKTEESAEILTSLPTPKHSDCWRGSYLNWQYKITLHGKGEVHQCGGQGTWCYYIFIPERELTKEDFAKIWLKPEKREGWSYISHDYFNTPIAGLDWHGGVTYYDKHGEVEGHRCVEYGCDYNHLYDDHRTWSLESVLFDVKRTIKQLNDLYPKAHS